MVVTPLLSSLAVDYPSWLMDLAVSIHCPMGIANSSWLPRAAPHHQGQLGRANRRVYAASVGGGCIEMPRLLRVALVCPWDIQDCLVVRGLFIQMRGPHVVAWVPYASLWELCASLLGDAGLSYL